MQVESIRERLHVIIFGHETPAGRAFDVALIAAILVSVVLVMLDSMAEMRVRYGEAFRVAEWFFTILFTIEYGLRLWCAHYPRRYAGSFYGIVDLVAVLPTYLAVLFPAGRFFTIVRILRVVRIFRVLKLVHFVMEGAVLSRALKASRYKITVFLVAVLTSVVVVGSLMYLIEGAASGFTSIPQSIYWAIVTITTVGYGDIAPATFLGKSLAAALMIMGYGIIAVPTGIVTLELDRAARAEEARTATCPTCGLGRHDLDAVYCKRCGTDLMSEADSA